jgi:hypothetical protein
VSIRRNLGIAIVAVLCAGALAGSAWAAYDYVYQNGTVGVGGMGNDFTVNYRNYNDSCSGDGYAWTKSIYGLSDGSWVASVETYNGCGITSKAHLGPSSNYGYNYVQAKCKNTNGTSPVWLRCNTTRP